MTCMTVGPSHEDPIISPTVCDSGSVTRPPSRGDRARRGRSPLPTATELAGAVLCPGEGRKRVEQAHGPNSELQLRGESQRRQQCLGPLGIPDHLLQPVVDEDLRTREGRYHIIREFPSTSLFSFHLSQRPTMRWLPQRFVTTRLTAFAPIMT